MKTISINLYSFDELSKEAQSKAISNLRVINVDFEWWENTYYDAEIIGLKLDTFDLDRNKHCKGEFIHSGYEVARNIIKEHGDGCNTYQIAKKYLQDYAKFEEQNGDNDNPFNKGVSGAEDREQEFLKELLQDYANLLQDEYEYRVSEEAIKETIEENGYTFEENGKIRNA
jgi:hypothetical protein